MILQTPHGVEGLATVFTHMRLGLLAQFVALAHVHRQCILVTVSTITSLLGTGIRHTAVLALVCLQSVLFQELCGADVALVNARTLRKKGLLRFKAWMLSTHLFCPQLGVCCGVRRWHGCLYSSLLLWLSTRQWLFLLSLFLLLQFDGFNYVFDILHYLIFI